RMGFWRIVGPDSPCGDDTVLRGSSSRIRAERWIAQQADLHRKNQVIGITASLADRRWVGLVEVE
ncbi:hypothetical protein, partial [Pseudomonas aeruginosa]|uniref:hypothetical protein n=1 Tax=Pseudomonas aeruginosa TaxID=287 RepID=UPI003F520779